ncbi:MAG: glycosyltransferase family protein [Acidimicrobiia bacterium]
MTLRLCFIDENAGHDWGQGALASALARRFDVSTVPVDRNRPRRVSDVPDYQSYDAFVWRVKFRHLMSEEPFDWQNYEGARLIFDMDAFQNFSAMISRRYLGQFPDVIRRNGFHALVCTGKAVRDQFRSIGINAHWVAKGYDASQIWDENRPYRDGISYFGRHYLARDAMLSYLTRDGIAFTEFRCGWDQLRSQLNQFLGCLVCNMQIRGAQRVPMRVLRALPKRWLRVEPGPEAMIKNFEVAAAGCAPINDAIPELADLGFQDGVTMVSYATFPELAEKTRGYLADPAALREIGRRAAALVRSRHTWDHRAGEVEELVRSRAYLPA